MSRLRNFYHLMWIVALVLFIGLILVGHGTYDYINGVKKSDGCSSLTTGVVVDFEKTTSITRTKQRKISYIATVEPKDGSIFNYSMLHSDPTGYAYQKGESVVIHYDPSDPSRYYIQYADPSEGNVTQIVVGAVLIFVGLCFWGIYKKVK